MKYSINKYRNPPPEPHPLLAPIRRPAWTPVGTGRFPMQDISPLFSNWLQEGIRFIKYNAYFEFEERGHTKGRRPFGITPSLSANILLRRGGIWCLKAKFQIPPLM